MIAGLLASALLTPPPVPPPPPAAMAAVAELRRIAPPIPEQRKGALDQAVMQIARETLDRVAKRSDYGALLPLAESRIRSRLADIQSDFDAYVGACLDARLGYSFDVATLTDMRNAVTTKGGNALWQTVLAEPLQRCTYESARDLFQRTNFIGAVAWLAGEKRLARLPAYGSLKAEPSALARALEALCEASPRGVLRWEGGGFVVGKAWMDRDEKRGGHSSFCLAESLTASGYQLRLDRR
jgi:hypothetical protein